MSKVFIEEHLKHDLNCLAKRKSYIPGVITGQIIGGDYHVVHLSAIAAPSNASAETEFNLDNILTYRSLANLLANTDTIFQKTLEVVQLLPGGSRVLGLFFIIPKDLKSVQPINLNFYKFHRNLTENLVYKQDEYTWNYLLFNYSTINKKLFCYTVDFNRSLGPEKTTYKLVNQIFGSFDNDWVMLIGKFNFGALDQLNVTGGREALVSIRDNLLEKFESVLNESIFTFNGCVCDESEVLKDFECVSIGNLLKNVINIEFYREVNSGDECKNASLQVERGKRKVLMSGLCSLAVPFNRNGTVKEAIKAIHEDALLTLAMRLRMHLESLVEEESVEEDGACNVMHETPRRILILKAKGSRFAFSEYVFPGESPQEALNIAGEVLNVSIKNLILYDTLEKGRHLHYETLPDVDGSPLQNASTVTSSNKMLFYFAAACLILAVFVHLIKKFMTLI